MFNVLGVFFVVLVSKLVEGVFDFVPMRKGSVDLVELV